MPFDSPARVRGVMVVDDSVIIDGAAAFVLKYVLSERVPGGLNRLLAEIRATPLQHQALVGAYRAFEEVGARWQAKIAASPFGNREGQIAAAALPSEAWITTKEAACLLGRSERRVRQLAEAGELASRLRSARREFLRAEVLEFRQRLGGQTAA